MRIGYNPHKDKLKPKSDYFHQVVIPVYIPNSEGYFKDSLQILKYCLESLFKTCHSKTFISLINNGSSKEVAEYINKLFEEGYVHEIVHTASIGKLNAVLKGVVGHDFELVTVTDADVLFLENWQHETYEIFNQFPKCGVVCPVPSPKVLKQFTSNIIVEKLFSKSMKFVSVSNPKALEHFAESIGNPQFYNKYNLDSYLAVENNGKRAVVGAAHFVATYRGALFSSEGIRYSQYSLGGGSENKILDEPVLKNGYWRLSTIDNFAYHMGNTHEKWIGEVLHALPNEISEVTKLLSFEIEKTNRMSFLIKEFLFKIIKKKLFWKKFLRYKGLTKQASNHY